MANDMIVANQDKCPTNLPFECAAPQVLSKVQQACAALMNALPGTVSKAADIHRALDIDPKLGWQVFRVAQASNSLAAGTHVPTPIPGERLAVAAESHGLPRAIITQLRQALAQFERLVSSHAGDRKSFEAMLAGLNSEAGDYLDVDRRKAAFTALSHIWGMRVRTRLWCAVYHRGSESRFINGASIRGLTGINRLRRSVGFQLDSFRALDSDRHTLEGEALESGQSVLLKEFCSQPLPQISHRKMPDGRLQTMLAPGEVGKLGSANLYMAEIFRELNWHHSDPLQRKIGNSILVTKPTEVLILDMLVEQGMFGFLEPSVSVYGDLERPGEYRSAQYNEVDRLPIATRVERLGIGSAALATPDVPDYPRMFTHVCRRLGWSEDSFEVLRCRLEYPVLHTVVAMSVPLPEKGNW